MKSTWAEERAGAKPPWQEQTGQWEEQGGRQWLHGWERGEQWKIVLEREPEARATGRTLDLILSVVRSQWKVPGKGMTQFDNTFKESLCLL